MAFVYHVLIGNRDTKEAKERLAHQSQRIFLLVNDLLFARHQEAAYICEVIFISNKDTLKIKELMLVHYNQRVQLF